MAVLGTAQRVLMTGRAALRDVVDIPLGMQRGRRRVRPGGADADGPGVVPVEARRRGAYDPWQGGGGPLATACREVRPLGVPAERVGAVTGVAAVDEQGGSTVSAGDRGALQ